MSDDTKTLIYRTLRSAIAAGVSSALLIQPDWSKPDQTFRILLIGFGAGFFTFLGKFIRDTWGNEQKDSKVDRLMPV